MAQDRISGGVSDEDNSKQNDETPGSAETGDRVCEALAEGRFLFDYVVGVAHGSNPNELLGGVELTTQDGKHIHSRMRLALQQNGYIVPVHFDTGHFLKGNGIRLMGRLVEHGS